MGDGEDKKGVGDKSGRVNAPAEAFDAVQALKGINLSLLNLGRSGSGKGKDGKSEDD